MMFVIQIQFHKALKINWCDDKIFFIVLIEYKVKCYAAMQLYWSLKNPGVGLNLCRDSDRQTVHIELNCTAFHLQLHNFPMHWIFSPWKKKQISTLDNLVLITPPEHWVEQIDTICQIFLYNKEVYNIETSRVTQMTLRPDTAVRCRDCRSQPQTSPHLSPSLSQSGHSNSAVNAVMSNKMQ